MISCGIDIGSTTIKALLLENGTVRTMEIMMSGANPPEGSARLLETILARAGLRRADVDHLVATGIGREHLGSADSIASEISCHAAGVSHVIPDAGTVIEIGGQDSKVIALEKDGRVKDFRMNDRCAAGTGRFLEGVARTLGMSLEEIGASTSIDLPPVEISAMCAVFAETEIIGLIHRGTPREAVLRGAFRSVARKVLGLAHGVGIHDTVVLTGGVARYDGVKTALQLLTGHTIIVPAHPQFTGALGAAVIGAHRATQAGQDSADRGCNENNYGRTTKQCCAGAGR